jgi:hypothetical protein
MRRAATSAVAALTLLAILGAAGAEGVLRDLRVGEDEAKRLVLSALEHGGAPIWSAAKAFRAASPAARVALVRGGVAWVREYVESPELARAYATLRERRRPEAPAQAGAPEEQLRALRAQQEQAIADLRRNAEKAQPEVRAALLDAARQAEAQLRTQQADPEMRKALLAMYATQATEGDRRHGEALRKWEEDFPADVRALAARRLRALLDGCADVDFGAALVEDDGRKVFADRASERRPALWKLCYRAGRQPVEAARKAATSWIAELERR